MSEAEEVVRVLTFDRHGRRFSLAIGAITAIIEDRPTTPVPLAPPGVAGLILHGGRLLTVLEFDRLFGDPGVDATASDPHLILLAQPFAHLALRVAHRPNLERTASPTSPLDLEAVVHELEAAIAHRGGPP